MPHIGTYGLCKDFALSRQKSICKLSYHTESPNNSSRMLWHKRTSAGRSSISQLDCRVKTFSVRAGTSSTTSRTFVLCNLLHHEQDFCLMQRRNRWLLWGLAVGRKILGFTYSSREIRCGSKILKEGSAVHLGRSRQTERLWHTEAQVTKGAFGGNVQRQWCFGSSYMKTLLLNSQNIGLQVIKRQRFLRQGKATLFCFCHMQIKQLVVVGEEEDFRIVVCEQGNYSFHITGKRFYILRAWKYTLNE